MAAKLDALEVFLADLTPTRAVVVVRLPAGEPHWSLSGIVRGPRCSRGSTLPASYPLQSRSLPQMGRGGMPIHPESNVSAMSECTIASALLTEPVFWSPDWPALYDLSLELRDGSQVLEHASRTIGIRPLKVIGRRLDCAGQFWVPRGVRRDLPQPADLGAFREHGAALLAPAAQLTDQLLATASELGVLVIAELSSQDDCRQELSRLSRHAAVAMVLLAADMPLRPAASSSTLLVRWLVQGEREPPPDDVRAALAQVHDVATFANWAGGLSRAVIAYRPLVETSDLATARAACDRLQRDLAPYGQFAGYIV